MDVSKYECPICLNWLNKPILTSCGHHFCESCIISWFEKNGSRCPIDDKELHKNLDIFPDNFTRREMSQQKIKCPNNQLGCSLEILYGDLENHLSVCPYQNSFVQCIFHNAGCQYKAPNQIDLESHMKTEIHEHLMLLHKMLNNNESLILKTKLAETDLWAPSKNGEQSFEGRTEHLIRAMYERIIVLEQRANEQDIIINKLSKQLAETKRIISDAEDFHLRYCNGTYIWNIFEFNEKIKQMRTDPFKMFYSEGFYTSPYGYRFCVRFNICKENPEFLSLHVHLMKTEHDTSLNWPFNGRICLSIIHPTNPESNINDTMMTRPDLEAFQRPTKLRNFDGYGYKQFIQINELISGGFIKNQTLSIKIIVTPV